MGLWNLYFAAKLYLCATGQVAPKWLFNILFASVLLFPLRRRWLRLLRQCLALPAGAALLYWESNLPPFARVASQFSNLQSFTPAYMLELSQRVISHQMIVTAMAALIAYAIVNRWVRVSTFVLLALLVVPMWQQVGGIAAGTAATRIAGGTAGTPGPAGVDSAAVAGDKDAQLAGFREQESKRQVSFGKLAAAPDAQFDIVVLHICSLAWDDLDVAKARNHPLLSRFDFLFKDFSSAASYSGPAAIRLLRASCGQQSHQALYSQAPAQCHLFEDLALAGFDVKMLMNHDGHFDNFLDVVQKEIGVPDVKPEPTAGLPVAMRAFDNSPILDDYAVLENWYKGRLAQKGGPMALYYNTVSLHDGNRLHGQKLTSLESYPLRVNKLLGDVDKLIELIGRSGRKAVVVFVPEHGAALRGDENQIAGMREIPSPRIVHVPVGVKLVGLPAPAAGQPLTIEAPSSFLALVQLLSNIVADSPFRPGAPALPQYANELPQTQMIGEGDDTVMLRRRNDYVVRGADGIWLEGKL
ncbi:cellulose biosynthesis protein BcsG [Cupriavidus sp. CV2]|uniref:cellulose biosynthesis protein BcsG n=1 Tax=Cupriavidus ulmosensis TaxID=3065913 RepID=UPI00296B2521|nr:cellulose biosynthesis protein BcsG [Cupriavidus sp. CV2]MDW3682879.1 cellulose biosynthesis protein BcsG [Cupriavidus sp. CV2]